MYKFISSFAAAALAIACSNPGSSQNEVLTIDVSQSYPLKEIHLQDIADVEYVPLAANDTFLLSQTARTAYWSETKIIIYDYTVGDIMIFDSKGNPLSFINRKGSSHEEYNILSDVKYNEANDELLAVEAYPARVHTYTLDGKFLRSNELPPSTDAISLFEYDAGKLLFTKGSLFLYKEDDDTKAEPQCVQYYLYSMHDLSVTDSFCVQVPKIVNALIMERSGDNIAVMLYYYYKVVNSDNGSHIVSNISSDTIYRISPSLTMTPIIARTPSVHSYKDMTCLNVNLDMPDYMLLQYGELKSGSFDAFTRRHLYYDKKSRKIYEYNFVNDDYRGRRTNGGISDEFIPCLSPRGRYACVLLQADDLLEALEHGKLNGRLKEIASGMTDDDNPVLMSVRFK